MRVEQNAGDEVQALLRSGRDEQTFGGRSCASALHHLSDCFEERRIASRRSVLKNGSVATRQELTRDVLKVRPGERLGRGKPWRKRDDVPPLRDDAAHFAN